MNSRDRLLLALWAVVALSGAGFVLAVDGPVFDDVSNLQDVERYGREGIGLDSLKAQVNPAGPLAYAWIGVIGSALGGSLRAYRLVVWTTWVVASAALWWSLQGRPSWSRHRVAFLALVCAPHLPTAIATVLTEVPSLALAAGSLALAGSGLTTASRGRALAGSLLAGLSVLGRQYFLAVLPAHAVLRGSAERFGGAWLRHATARLAIAAAPVLGLIFVWGGLTPPALRDGTAYQGRWSASVGVDASRPVSCALTLGVYLLPLSLSAWRRRTAARNLVAACVLGALAAGSTTPWASGSGPIRSAISAATAGLGPAGGSATQVLMAVLGAWSLLTLLPQRTRGALALLGPSRAPATVFTLAYVLEQAGVGGNIPFYDRYCLCLVPFAVVALARRRVSRWSVAALCCMLLLGQVMLWRHATG